MPFTGPGDDVLDAIEAGKADDVLMKDYKLNNDQVKAFRSLYYGLSNRRMKYDQIKDYYPELKSYFTGPTLQQAPEATAMPKEDFTKPVKEKAIVESTSRSATVPVKTGLTNQDILNNKVRTAQQTLNTALDTNDDIVEKMIRNQRYEAAKQQGYNEFAAAPRSDMPAANMLANMRNQIDPQTPVQDLPVSLDEVGQLKGEIKTNEPQARQFINQIIVRKPDKATDLQSSIYALDANARLQENPSVGNKVVENLKAIEENKLKYNAQTRQLVKELPFFQSLVAGVKQRTESLEGYKMLQLPKNDVIKIMEQRRAAYDPDQPIEVPKGAGEIGQMFGSEWATLLKGAAITTASSVVGGEAAAPYISAAVNAPEYYKRGYESAFTQTYNELRGQGKSEDESYEGAMKQAKIEAKYDAAEGFISSFIGARIGLKELPKFNITGGFKNAVTEVLTKSKHFVAETTVEGLTDGLIAGYLQDKKNRAAREAGLFRSDDTIKEAIKGELTFALAAGAMSQAGRAAVDPSTYKKILYWISKQPEETTNAKLGEMVLHGDLSQEDADDIQEQIKQQKTVDKTVPEDIKDVSRMAIIDKIAKRDELEEKKKTVDEALRGPIEVEIKEINKQILEHSTHKKEVTETEEQTQPEAIVTDTVTPEPGAAGTTGIEGAAPVTATDLGSTPIAEAEAVTPNEQHWTDPTTNQSFVLRDGKLYAKMSNGDMEFSEKAMQTKNAKEIVENIKHANAPTPDVTIEESAGSMASTAPKIKPNKQQAEFYQSNMGAKPSITGRVMPDPIVAAEPKKLRQIVKDVSVGLEQRLIYAKPGRGAIGAYLPGFKGIKINRNNDLDTIAHELGHSIDDHFDLYTKIAQDPAALQELDQFASYGSNPPSGHPNPRKYIDKEGFAEWLRAYVVNPKAAESMAPLITELFRKHTSKKFQETIDNFSMDVRILAGVNGSDIMKSNIDFEPDKPKGLLGKLFKKEETNNEFSISWVNRIAANFINPLNAFEKAFKYAKGLRGLDEVLPENDPLILSRVLLGIDGKFGEILKSGMINGRGDVLSDNGNAMNFDWLLEPMDNTTSGTIKKDMEDTILYMVAERTVELSKKLERAHELTGASAGMEGMSDLSVANKTLSEFENGDPNRLARLQEAARRYRLFADATLSYAVDKGRLSEEAYEYITENNEQYVALQRVMETAPGQEISDIHRASASLGSKGEILYKVKGSTKTIINPYIPLLDTLYKTMRESDRNDVLRAFRDLLVDPRYSNEGDPKRYSDIGMIATPSDTDSETIPIFINGKPEKWIFQQDIHNQLRGLDKEAYRIPKAFKMPAEVLRFFTTHFPTFAVRNVIRDTQDRLIKSTTGSGFASLIGSQEDWHAIARAGGLNAGHYTKSKNHYYGLLTEAMSAMAQDKRFILSDPALLKRMWGTYTDLLNKGETVNRVAEYRSAFKEAKGKGMDDYNASIYAAYKARNLIDFAIMGNWMKIINQIIPFSNAAVQGMRSAAYSFQKSPGWFLANTAIYSVAPGILAWFWNHRNDEDEKWYEEMPGYQRDLFWNFRIGANKWLSIPKPYELAIPQMTIDRTLSYFITGNKKAYDGLPKEILQLISPFDEGNLAGPYQGLVEGLTNHDFFRDRTIIPPDEDPLNLALRHTETATRLGQLLQKYTGVDARKWDHFIRRQFSYTGNLVLKLSDIGRDDSRNEFDFTDTGLFKRTPAYNSVSVQNMISYAKEFGLTRTPAYKGFNAIVGDYFNADTDEQREEIAQKLIDYSKELLNAWETERMDIYKIEAAEAKKAEEKRLADERKAKKTY